MGRLSCYLFELAPPSGLMKLYLQSMFINNSSDYKLSMDSPIKPEDEDPKMEVSVREWEHLQYQIKRLKEQNMYLRQKAAVALTPTLTKKNSLFVDPFQIKQVVSLEKQTSDKQKFKKQMTDWAKKMAIKKKRASLMPIEIALTLRNAKKQSLKQIESKRISLFQSKDSGSSNNVDSPIKEQVVNENHIIKEQEHEIQKEEIHQTNKQNREYLQNQFQQNKKFQKLRDELRLIQNICLFGPSQEDLQGPYQNGRIQSKNTLLYSSNPLLKQQYEMYGHQFYSQEGVPSRRLKQQETTTYGDQTIFRKNAKRIDCSLCLFMAEEERTNKIYGNEVLNRVNAAKRLAVFFVQFSDFIFVEGQQEKQEIKNVNKSVENSKKIEKFESIDEGQGSQRQSRRPTKKYCIKTKYCLCIFTYFPFVNVMEQLITSMMDEIKIRRVQHYAMTASLEKVSINYFIEQLNSVCHELTDQILAIQMHIGEQIKLNLGHFKISFNFMEARLDNLLFGGWVFDILKIFHRDMIYDIFTNIMAEEESICFVCQNLKFLTEVVYFFISVLPNPFQYPHLCVSRCMNYDYLDSPFVVTLGINQGTKWVEQNAMNYEKKIFVNLNDNQVRVVGKRKLKNIKSEKLKKIFHNFYKKLQGSSPVPMFFKKKQQTIIRPAAKEENQLVYSLLRSLHSYFKQQIVVHMPNPQIVNTLKEASPQLNEHSKISSILKEIQKYVRESRRPNEKQKDGFIEQILDQQIFYMYASQIYHLQ